MAILKKLRNLKDENNTGFGTGATNTGGRFVNRDGGANVIKKGVGVFYRHSWYHTMLGMKRSKFLFLLFSSLRIQSDLQLSHRRFSRFYFHVFYSSSY